MGFLADVHRLKSLGDGNLRNRGAIGIHPGRDFYGLSHAETQRRGERDREHGSRCSSTRVLRNRVIQVYDSAVDEISTSHLHPGSPMTYALTELQLAIMKVLWDRGEAGVQELHESLLRERRVAQSTIATL